MFPNIGLGEIILIAIVLMVLFGGQKFPELSRGIAQAVKEFRHALQDDDDDGSPQQKPKYKA
jgi:sec-independent protein translocase protein TatA